MALTCAPGALMANTATKHLERSKDIDKYSELLRSGVSAPHGYVVLLGLNTFELPALLREVSRGLPFRSYERFARSAGMPSERLLKLLDIPRRTLLRRKVTGRFLPDESDRLVRAA